MTATIAQVFDGLADATFVLAQGSCWFAGARLIRGLSTMTRASMSSVRWRPCAVNGGRRERGPDLLGLLLCPEGKSPGRYQAAGVFTFLTW